jgi:tRNA threonylcarbamoyladenosine biosynthesis protein TsaB
MAAPSLLAVLDARMHEVYHAGYHYADGRWSETRGLGLCAPEALQCLRACRGGQCPPPTPNSWRPAPHVHALPTATAMLRLAPSAWPTAGWCRPRGAAALYPR